MDKAPGVQGSTSVENPVPDKDNLGRSERLRLRLILKFRDRNPAQLVQVVFASIQSLEHGTVG